MYMYLCVCVGMFEPVSLCGVGLCMYVCKYIVYKVNSEEKYSDTRAVFMLKCLRFISHEQVRRVVVKGELLVTVVVVVAAVIIVVVKL